MFLRLLSQQSECQIAVEDIYTSDAGRLSVEVERKLITPYEDKNYVLHYPGTFLKRGITSERPYRETMDYKRIHTELVTNSGTQFDTDIASVFSRLMEEGKISCLETPTELHMGKI